MENTDAETNNVKLKVPQSTLAFDTDDIFELRLFLKTLHEILEKDCWGSRLGYSTRSNSDKKCGKETEITEPIKTDSQVKLNKVQIKTIKFNRSANNVKSIHEEGTTSSLRSYLITEKSEQVHTNSVNIGSITQKQLKQKLKDLHMKDKRKRSRKNKNGKGDKRNALALDNGCLRHMTGYKSLLSEFEEKENCEIVSKSDGKITLTGVRHGSLYEARFFTRTDNSEVCLLSRASMEDSFNVMYISKKRYAFVIVDEFTRYTWVYFLHTKDKSPSILLDCNNPKNFELFVTLMNSDFADYAE
ncbi:hypothetical protein AgCh_025192 [Apium graveolens]